MGESDGHDSGLGDVIACHDEVAQDGEEKAEKESWSRQPMQIRKHIFEVVCLEFPVQDPNGQSQKEGAKKGCQEAEDSRLHGSSVRY